MVREQDEALGEREAALARLEQDLRSVTSERDAVRLRAEQFAQELELIRLRRSGPASQRHVEDDTQGTLAMFGDVTSPPRLAVVEAVVAKEPSAPSRRLPVSVPQKARRRSREDFRHLPSRKVVCPAPPDQACAKCKGALRVVGKAESFRIAWVPGHFVVEDLVRDKCACPDCPGEGVLTVPAPYALDKALCADSLLARILVDKFGDHLPLNRQADRMAREGLDVGTNTLSAWVVGAAAVLRPVAQAVRTELLAAAFLQGDDTGMPVQDGGDGALRKGRFWAFTDQKQVFYAFTDTKQGHFPEKLLEGFKGDCLLVDGGTEFNKVVDALDLERAGCWSHLRTYFFDALAFHPAEANTALGTLRDLFLLKRQLAALTADERLAERKKHAAPLVDGLFRWFRELSTLVRPKSKLMEALTYALNQEDTLRVFLERGDVPIQNNLSELLLRQPVVGRKNWLFAGSEGGAQAAATLFTLIGSCRLQGVDPHAFLVDVLGRVQDCKQPKSLTPRAWRWRGVTRGWGEREHRWPSGYAAGTGGEALAAHVVAERSQGLVEGAFVGHGVSSDRAGIAPVGVYYWRHPSEPGSGERRLSLGDQPARAGRGASKEHFDDHPELANCRCCAFEHANRHINAFGIDCHVRGAGRWAGVARFRAVSMCCLRIAMDYLPPTRL